MIEKYKASSIDQFLKIILSNLKEKFIYRGQSSSLWLPIPAVFREERKKGDYLELIPFECYEKELLDEFKRLSASMLQRTPVDDWEYLSIARHHGLPTRYLDWSENPLVALYFSVENQNERKDSAVWGYSHDYAQITFHQRTNKYKTLFDIKEIAVYRPPYLHHRISVQAGLFTVHPYGFDEINGWRGKLVKIKIPSEYRFEIRKSLELIGIHRASLFPDLDGIAEHIKRTLKHG